VSTSLETKRIIKQIQAMDNASEDFWEVFQVANEKYFTVEGEKDDFQQAAIALNAVLHRGDEWMVQVCAKIAMELFNVVQEGNSAAHGSFALEQGMYFFDIYKDKDALESIHKMFKNAVVMKANSAI